MGQVCRGGKDAVAMPALFPFEQFVEYASAAELGQLDRHDRPS